jgi:hypothetical protein
MSRRTPSLLLLLLPVTSYLSTALPECTRLLEVRLVRLVRLVRQNQAFDVTKDAFFVVVATAGNVVYSRLPSRNVRACWRSACVGEMKRG